ncbi:hypothetical protein BFP97_11235 [Roseivirga sp. 4D4]|uniref:hypothetical protein n=1 Tax=Roseivirga sp. 4D4 TaxID=1889784 RepID=UPI000853874B|nr:hypothetical protein [Roseivirga sp. 4D4]OEK02059.1 hypothetical protein BFP97_11235 [Roseivirga sp. 4D4]
MSCSTRKYQYYTQDLAETALIDQHIYKGFLPHEGPQNVYECDQCGHWHLTSKAPERNSRLQEMIDSGEMKRKQEASKWERGF